MVEDSDGIPALAVYGSLAPGESNHWVVSRISGEWLRGVVRGYQFEIGWGPAEGYQGFVPDADGVDVPVAVLVSDELSKKWREIDDFEGEGYQRSAIDVTITSGSPGEGVRQQRAQIYVALTDVD